MKKNKTSLFVLSLSAVLLLAGCGPTPTSSDSSGGGGTMTDTSSTPIGTSSTQPVEATLQIVGAPETALPGATIKLTATVTGTDASVVWKLTSLTGTAEYPTDATIDAEGNLFVGTYEDVLTITATAGEATDSVEIEIVGPELEADGLGIANGFRLANTDLFTDAGGAHVAVNLDITPTGIYSGLYDAGYVGDGDAAYVFSNDGKGGYYYNTTLDLVEDTTIGGMWADMDLTAALDGYIYSYYEPEDLDAGVIANNVYLKMYDEDSDDPELYIYYTLGLSDVIGADLVATQLHVEAVSGAALSIDFLYSYEGSLYYIDFDIYEKAELDQKPYAVAIEDGGSTEEGVTEPWGE